MKILIKNGRIINPKSQLDLVSDLLVEDGLVKEIGNSLTYEVDEIIDASGK